MTDQEAASPFAAERAKLERRLGSLEKRRRAVMAALEGITEAERRLAAVVADDVEDGDAPLRPATVSNSANDARPAGKRFQVIAQLLSEAGRPLTVPEMAREMIRRGDDSTVDKLRDIIHAICRRKPDLFERDNRDGLVVWRLKAVPNLDTTPT